MSKILKYLIKVSVEENEKMLIKEKNEETWKVLNQLILMVNIFSEEPIVSQSYTSTMTVFKMEKCSSHTKTV